MHATPYTTFTTACLVLLACAGHFAVAQDKPAGTQATTPVPVLDTKTCPPGKPLVKCFQAPCNTPQCKAKCKKAVPPGSSPANVLCIDNYCGSCSCNCCLAKHAPCRRGLSAALSRSTTCCPGTICDYALACVVTKHAKCGLACIPPEEAASKCLKDGAQCDPTKIQCCKGSKCKRGLISKTYRCHD